MSVNSNNTATLPDDYVDWSKVGVVGSDGLVYVLGENKNINYSQKYSTSGGNFYDTDGDGLTTERTVRALRIVVLLLLTMALPTV